MFINYDPQTGLSITTSPEHDNYEITAFVELMQREVDCSCPLDMAKEALEDGSLWTDDDQSTIEMVHELITLFQL